MLTDIIKKSTLFKRFTDEEIGEILDSRYCNILKIDKNSYVFQQEDEPTSMFVLIDGSVQVEKTDVNGKRTIVNIFTDSGTVFGEVYLYLSDHPYDYGCLARKQSTILSIDKEFFKGDSNTQKQVVQNMLEILSEKAFHLNQKLLIMGSFTLKQKIANYLLQKLNESKEVNLIYNREELADYLGTTRPSLSRELSNMERSGLLKLNRNSIEIIDLEELKNII